ncbi:TPA: MetQ/NlpA family ABC transporter substrate-binding protein [Streptococcus suis]
MFRNLQKCLFVLGLTALTFILGACNTEKSAENISENKIIHYGKAAGPYTVLFEDAIIPILEKKGYSFEVTEFSDLVQNDTALAEGDIDVNVEQHTAYMNNFNSSNNANLVALTPIPTVAAALYSSNHKSLNEIKNGAKIAIPSDPSNTSRALAIIEKANWITLDKTADRTALTVDDIVDNKYNIEFILVESAQIPPALDDFDYAVIVGAIVYSAKIDPSTALLKEDIADHLWLQVVVKEDNKNSQWAKDIVEAYQSDEFAAYLEENNDGLWSIPSNN